eukprot:18703-Prorocentrum_minimum.AAC.7
MADWQGECGKTSLGSHSLNSYHKSPGTEPPRYQWQNLPHKSHRSRLQPQASHPTNLLARFAFPVPRLAPPTLARAGTGKARRAEWGASHHTNERSTRD